MPCLKKLITFAKPTLMLITKMVMATKRVLRAMATRKIRSVLMPPNRNINGSMTFFIIRSRPNVLGAKSLPLERSCTVADSTASSELAAAAATV